MSETKHTPGPWGRFPEVNGGPTTIIACVAEGGVVSVGVVNLAGDARLIAAAPETAAERDRLREVNRELVEALRPLVAIVNGARVNRMKRDGYLVAARAAIRLAKGE